MRGDFKSSSRRARSPVGRSAHLLTLVDRALTLAPRSLRGDGRLRLRFNTVPVCYRNCLVDRSYDCGGGGPRQPGIYVAAVSSGGTIWCRAVASRYSALVLA